MAGNMGTPATGNPSQGASQMGAMSGDGGMPQSGMQLPDMTQNSMQGASGGKGGGAGAMQPQASGLGAPSSYGSDLPQPSSTPSMGMGGTSNQMNSGMALANGTMSVPGYAYGSTSVAGYAQGTMGAEDDPWNWTKKEQVAPLAASIKPAEIVVPQAMPDQTEQYLGQQATAMGTNAAAKGIDAAYKAYNAPLTTNAITSMGTTASGAPVALTNAGALSAPASSSMYALNAPTTIGGSVQGVSPVASSVLPTVVGAGEVAAPLGSSLAGLSTGVAAAEGTALATGGAAATGATTAGMGAAAGLGGEAALAAMGPVGMVIGGALLAKKLGIF